MNQAIALNTRTGAIQTVDTEDAREAVRLAFLADHDVDLSRVERQFLRVEPRSPLGWALGDWFALDAPNPVAVLADLAFRADVADEEAKIVVITDRRQRRRNRSAYLRRHKKRSKALVSVFAWNLGDKAVQS